MTTHFYANLDADDSYEMRCVRLVERCCPRLMITGGGALPQELLYSGRRISDDTRASIRTALRASGGYNMSAIAKAHKVARSTVCKIHAKMVKEARA